ncbi:MAG: hypothetical protein ACHQIM_18515 [Sphingobacteriales bacterium]
MLTYLKKNLLGIAVTLGVCSFVYEGLIKPSFDFTLTKYTGALVILIAIYSRREDNLIRKERLSKKKNEL